jgi:hypothetical protein
MGKGWRSTVAYATAMYEFHNDFRRQLKARLVKERVAARGYQVPPPRTPSAYV